MLSWLAPVIVFGLVIFVHELGHFIAAKLTGVYAPRFSIGFGPALWRKRWGETEYRVAILPFGGYVRMASKDDEATAFLEMGDETSVVEAKGGQELDPEAMKPFGPKDVPSDRWFESKPLAARLFIMLAGVTMNVVLAFVLCVGILVYYGRPRPMAGVEQVVAGKPAADAGLRAGDSVVAAGGAPIRTWTDFQQRIEKSAGVPLTITFLRNGARMTATVTPLPEKIPDTLSGGTKVVGKIGVQPKSYWTPIPASEALGGGFGMTKEMAGLVFRSLRDIHLSQLGGPIAIAQASVQVARSGFVSLLLLVATISVNLAVVNLLPIPILDGGQIVVNVLEAIKGSPFTLRTRENILRGGLLVIACIFALVMFNDISRNVDAISGFFARLFGGRG